jgi:Uma2 family endonuclease
VAPGTPTQRNAATHTYADDRSWQDWARYELIDGVAYAMGPASARIHQERLGAIFRQVADALDGTPCRPYIAPFDVRLPTGDEADAEVSTVVQPDLVVICDPAKLDDAGCRGAPDWVVEVLSPRTAGHDQTVKLPAFEHGGVPEVWLVHPTDRVLNIYRLEGARYGRPEIRELNGTVTVGVLPSVLVEWDRALPAG